MEHLDVLKRILLDFISTLNNEYVFYSLHSKEEVMASYSHTFLENLSKSKKIPFLAPCIYFTYILQEELTKRSLSSEIITLFIKENDEIKIHFSLKLLGIYDGIILEFLHDTLYILDDGVTIVEKVKKNNIVLDSVIFDTKTFPEDLISLPKEKVCGWSFQSTLQNVYAYYSNFEVFQKPLQIKLNSYK